MNNRMKEIWINLRLSKGFSCESYLWDWFWKMIKNDSEGKGKGIPAGGKSRQQGKRPLDFHCHKDNYLPKWLGSKWFEVVSGISSLASKRTCKLSCVCLTFLAKNGKSFLLRVERRWTLKMDRQQPIQDNGGTMVLLEWMKTPNMAMHIPCITVVICRALEGWEL